VDFQLRIVTVPEVQQEARRNSVETEKNRDKFSNSDTCVTCDDVCCFLYRGSAGGAKKWRGNGEE